MCRSIVNVPAYCFRALTVVLAIGIASIAPPNSNAADLVHHWAFDGNTADSSGSGNDGVVSGDITYVDGKYGQAAYFDELDDLVENDKASNLPLEPEDTWSMSVWYNLEQFPSLAYGGGFGGRLDNQRVHSFLSFGPGGSNEDNAFYFWGSNIDVYAGEDYDTDGNWHMYTVTFDGEILAMYEDGSEVFATDSDKQGDLIADEFFARGPLDAVVSLGGPSHWDKNILGAVDDFKIWNGALTADEVAQLFAGGGGGIVGDFNNNGDLDAADIDLLYAEVRAGTNAGQFDLDKNQRVDAADAAFWVNEVRRTYFGDANLDGEFDSTDFVVVFQAGEYEDAVANNSTWASGDWNGDTEFDSSDFVHAFQASGYEAGPRVAVAAVPEPTGIGLLCVGFAGLGLRGRRAWQAARGLSRARLT